MALFKCKMCGGTLEITNETVAVCEYCGTNQTLPKLDDDRRANLYDRANHFRRNNEFDKAMGIYERILNEDNTDAEAYWSLVLCRYGIEYVEDPASHKRIPTVNRAQFTSIFDDDNYKSALQYADGYQRSIYEEEAKTINEIQKGILAISQKEEPFDVFICYKETDNNGRRTPDSVLANDLYHQLTQEGFKVFFARITLEDKLGSAYEPYIFAALNSAKVMVVLGTKPEHFNAVWVKNEWSRYLALIKNGAKKMLIPAYRDMDPYDLPEEFSHLQAQDMGKLGFMQDLIRGIKKIAQTEEPKPTVVKETVVAAGNANTAPLLKRAFMFLEDGEWSSADEYCEKVLDMDPECAEAYLGKLMAELKVKMQDELKNCAEPFDKLNHYGKVIRFADEALQQELKAYIDHINERNENTRLENAYLAAKQKMSVASMEESFKEAARAFDSISHYRDAAKLVEECREKAEKCRVAAEAARIEGIYNNAKVQMNSATTEIAFKKAANFFDSISDFRDAAKLAEECREKAETARRVAAERAEASRKDAVLAKAGYEMARNTETGFEKAILIYSTIPGWKDADARIEECSKKIEEIEAKREADRLKREQEKEAARKEAERIAKRNKKIGIIVSTVGIVAIALLLLVYYKIIIPGKYDDAVALMERSSYNEAIVAFEELGDYRDSANKIIECEKAIMEEKYSTALSMIEEGKNDEAYAVLYELENFKDSAIYRQNLEEQYPYLPLTLSKVGDTVFYGRYTITDNQQLSPIEWVVLEIDEENSKALLVTKMVIDSQPFHSSGRRVANFSSSTLYAWLQNAFKNLAFSDVEQKYINDPITIPSEEQVSTYDIDDADFSGYARSVGERHWNAMNGNRSWEWWRSDVTSDGESALISIYFTDDIDEKYGVRPMIWVTTEG